MNRSEVKISFNFFFPFACRFTEFSERWRARACVCVGDRVPECGGENAGAYAAEEPSVVAMRSEKCFLFISFEFFFLNVCKT